MQFMSFEAMTQHSDRPTQANRFRLGIQLAWPLPMRRADHRPRWMGAILEALWGRHRRTSGEPKGRGWNSQARDVGSGWMKWTLGCCHG